MYMILRICQVVEDEAVKGGEGEKKRGKVAAGEARPEQRLAEQLHKQG